MRITRPALCLGLVASLVGAGAAEAAKKPVVKPVCHLVTDPAGDASVQAPLPSDDTLDIVSADVATNASTLTAVLRLKNLSGQSYYGNDGVSYEVNFTVPTASNPIFLSLGKDPSGSAAQWGDVEQVQGVGNDTPKGAATAVVDKAKNEIRISAKLSDLSTLGKLKPGTKVSAIDAKSWVLIGTPLASPSVAGLVGPGEGLLQPVDDATGGKSYVVGTPSCVKVGS